ncbi:hypothetical protein C4A74_03681 [Escherichia coli]|nr:hypothetical protein C4A72_03574 [Escherichia coli]RDO57701.1 hypothetical protein C4A74_03681 [Escherichia coli]RDO84992.1 hypothetical protein C4A67_03221 [Escherichia coli]RDQ13615.1 hypothetical protein C4A37_03609 [Escherichia coli]
MTILTNPSFTTSSSLAACYISRIIYLNITPEYSRPSGATTTTCTPVNILIISKKYSSIATLTTSTSPTTSNILIICYLNIISRNGSSAISSCTASRSPYCPPCTTTSLPGSNISIIAYLKMIARYGGPSNSRSPR